MLRMFVEEAAALASITLFVAMIAVWAQVIPQLWGRAETWSRPICGRVGEKPDDGCGSCVPRGLGKAKASPLWWRVGRASVAD